MSAAHLFDLAISLLRLAVIVAAIPVAWVFRNDARSLLAGRFTAPSLTGGSLFWFGALALLYQVVHIAGVSPLWRATLMLGTILALALAVAAWRRRLNMTQAQLDAVSANLGLALAISNLAALDPDYADELAGLIRARTAERMVENHG